MSALEKASQLAQQLRHAVDNESPPCSSALGALKELQVLMTRFNALPPLPEETATARQERELARSAHESAVLISAKIGDSAMLDRHMAQLTSLYQMFDPSLGPSELRGVIRGLHLLHLLVENRLAEFHAQLELFSEAERADNCVAYVAQLEEQMARGAYNKVLASRHNVPCRYYAPLMGSIVEAVREEIAECSAVAYRKLRVSEAARMMLFDSEAAFTEFAQEREGWHVAGDGFVYFEHEEGKKAEVPAVELLSNAIEYANEIERIV